MNSLFLTILNMSLTGAFVIAMICFARLLLKRAPKIISYGLWAVAWFRLIMPFSFESVISLIPFNSTPIPPDIAMQAVPRIDSGIPAINNAVSYVLPAATPTTSANPLQIWTAIGAYIWLVGILVMLLYGVISYFKLKKKMASATLVEEGIYETDKIQSPFVLGIIKPMIYLPVDLAGQERDYIIIHERTHIRRYDHISKLAAYFILCLHWFNPLTWVAFILMGVDMEMACDERVLKEIGIETKKDYSLSLLSLAAGKRLIGGSPLAFSEGGLKTRIKNVLKFRKASLIIVVVAVVLAVGLSVGLALNRSSPFYIEEQIVGTRYGYFEPQTVAEDASALLATEEHSKEMQEEMYISQLGSDIRKMILTSNHILDCMVFLSFQSDELLPQTLSASVILTLERESGLLSYSQVLWIAEIIRGSVPDIKDEDISISDTASYSYPIGEKDEDIIEWIIHPEGTESMSVTSVEAAERYGPFPIKQPTILPANAFLDNVIIMPTGGTYLANGYRIIYDLEVDDTAWNHLDSLFVPSMISLTQLDLGGRAGGAMYFMDEYNAAPWKNEETGDESTQIMLGETKALIWANHSALIGPPYGIYIFNVTIVWFDEEEGIYYQLSVHTPDDMLTLDDLIEIALSVE